MIALVILLLCFDDNNPWKKGNKERSSAEKLGLGSLRNVPYTAGSRLAVSCRQLLELKCADWSAGYQ